jgi:hypothetical protein
MSRTWLIAALLAAPAFAAVDGIVTNATTGKPQPNVVVSLVQPGQGGMQTLASVKTDAQGKFAIDKSAEGIQLIQAMYEGVPYVKMIQPGSPSSNLRVDVYDATKDPATAKVSQHIVFLQPASDQLTVNEVYFLKNDTNKTYNNPSDGTLRFYVPGDKPSLRVTVSVPGGMPLQRAAEPTRKPGIYKVDYPAKPGETEFNIIYALPVSSEFASKSLEQTDTRLVVPMGVTLEGEGLTQLGADPSGKAMLYSVKGPDYSVKINGSVSTSQGGGSQEDDTGAPGITQTNPRLYSQLPVVIALASAVLMLGFVILYRATRNSAASKGKARR